MVWRAAAAPTGATGAADRHGQCGIAAITLAQGAQLATGNVADFVDLGLELINPWNTP